MRTAPSCPLTVYSCVLPISNPASLIALHYVIPIFLIGTLVALWGIGFLVLSWWRKSSVDVEFSERRTLFGKVGSGRVRCWT